MRKVLVLLACAAIVFGCGGGKTVEGKWNVTTPAKDMPPGSTMVAEFNDGKMKMTLDMDQPIPTGGKIGLHADVTGTYTVSGDTVTINAEDAKFSGTGFPDAVKGQMESTFKSMSDQLKTEINKNPSQKIVWVDNDTFTTKGKNGDTTYKRIK